MRFLTLVAYASSAMGLALPAQDEPTSPSVSTVSHSGNGCPQGSRVDSLNGGTSFRFHDFAAKSPGGDQTQNCALHFTITGDAGWQVSIKHVSIRGYAQIPVGSTITYWFTYFFSEDAGNTSSINSVWENEDEKPVNAQVVLELDVPESKRVWSPCAKGGGILNPNFRAAVQDSGYFGTRGSIVTTETLTYEWREC